MISTATRERPKTTVWRPARRNGSAHRSASVIAEPAGARGAVEDRRIDQQQVLLAGGRTVAIDHLRSVVPVSSSASSPGLPMVAEQHTITGLLP